MLTLARLLSSSLHVIYSQCAFKFTLCVCAIRIAVCRAHITVQSQHLAAVIVVRASTKHLDVHSQLV
jgi:cytidine deaminase